MVHEIKKFFFFFFSGLSHQGACMGKEDVLEDGCKM